MELEGDCADDDGIALEADVAAPEQQDRVHGDASMTIVAIQAVPVSEGAQLRACTCTCRMRTCVCGRARVHSCICVYVYARVWHASALSPGSRRRC
eukprot:296231-Alexandrium_andersonii.AAC.1